MEKNNNWHSMPKEEIFEKLNSRVEGLSNSEVFEKLNYYGTNELISEKPPTILKLIITELNDIMVFVLILASLFSMLLNEWTEAIVILIIIIINVLIGIIQTKKATSALDKLKNLNPAIAYVIRDGGETLVPASALVPGDIVYLEDGAIVPADLRLFETYELQIEESSLTGESVSSNKDETLVLDEQVLIGDRINMAYSGTIVMHGNGLGVVVNTGMNTEIGKIASMLNKRDNVETPLKQKLNLVGKSLVCLGLIISIIIFIVGTIYGRPFNSMILLSISLAISVIPEGLPTIATTIMALGVDQMAIKNALVRKLPAVETLGSATVICSDKTGTLTQNKMTVTHIAMNGDFEKGKPITINESVSEHQRIYKEIIYGASLCNNANVDRENNERIIGDPTEGALLYLVQKFGVDQQTIEDNHPRLYEQPFDSKRKMMTTVHEINNEIVAYTKGAVDEILPLCSRILTDNGIRPITNQDIDNIKNLYLNMSSQALRVLGFAKKNLANIPEVGEDIENNLIFIGITGMIDPPREEVIEAIKTITKAGIKTIMITGDHEVTALAIAKQIGIYKEGNNVITGRELNEMSDEKLFELVKTTTVFARVSPNDKLRIVKSLQKHGEIVAMTGDGVNDAPALKIADIGVAMGKTGTDVSREAADMILLDDNFTTIEYAISAGRRIYRNIQKVIQFLLSGNISEVLTLFIATVFNWDAPILAIHILLINLVTDTLPALALGVEPADSDVMDQHPVKEGTLFEREIVINIIFHGIFLSIVTLLAHKIGTVYGNDVLGTTMAFSTLVVSQLFLSLSHRSNRELMIIKKEHNIPLYLAIIISGLILISLIFIEPVQQFLKLTHLSLVQWSIVMFLSIIPCLLAELMKIFRKLKL